MKSCQMVFNELEIFTTLLFCSSVTLSSNKTITTTKCGTFFALISRTVNLGTGYYTAEIFKRPRKKSIKMLLFHSFSVESVTFCGMTVL